MCDWTVVFLQTAHFTFVCFFAFSVVIQKIIVAVKIGCCRFYMVLYIFPIAATPNINGLLLIVFLLNYD